MKWLADFAASQPVAYAVLILAGVAISGLAIGQIRVRGIRLGVAGVLWARFDSIVLTSWKLVLSSREGKTTKTCPCSTCPI